jgi:hypothetical protein
VNPALLTPGQQFTVALTLTPAAPVWGTAQTLVFQAPTMTAINSTPSEVAVGWSLPAPTTIASVTAFVYDMQAQATVISGNFTGAGGRLVPPVALSATGNYAVFVAGANGVASGPTQASSKLMLKAPSVASVIYAAGSGANGCLVTVTPQAASPAPGDVVAQLLAEGSVVAEQPVTNGSAVFTLAAPLTPLANWQVRLFYRSGIVSGPPGIPWSVSVPAAPAITALYYAPGAITAELATDPVPRATVAVFKGSPSGVNWVAATAVTTAVARLSVDAGSLDPTQSYSVAASTDPTALPVVWGPAVTLVFQQPTLGAISMAANQVDAVWTLPATTSISSVAATLYDQTAKQVVATAQSNAGSARLTAGAPLDATHHYVLTATGCHGIAMGPPATSAQLVVAAPALQSLTYQTGAGADKTRITAHAATADSRYPTLGLYLDQGEALLNAGSGSGTTAQLALASPLDPGYEYQVALAWQDAQGARGPLSNRLALIVEAASPGQVAYDGQTVSAQWVFFPGTPKAQPTGVKLAILDADAKEVAHKDLQGTQGSLVPAPALTPGAAYTLRVSALKGGGRRGRSVCLRTSSPRCRPSPPSTMTAPGCWSHGAPQPGRRYRARWCGCHPTVQSCERRSWGAHSAPMRRCLTQPVFTM